MMEDQQRLKKWCIVVGVCGFAALCLVGAERTISGAVAAENVVGGCTVALVGLFMVLLGVFSRTMGFGLDGEMGPNPFANLLFIIIGAGFLCAGVGAVLGWGHVRI